MPRPGKERAQAETAVQNEMRRIPELTRRETDASDFSKPVFAVRVGEPSTVFFVDEELICKQSHYFKTAFATKRTNGNLRVVDLPDQEARTFNIYLNWLHRGRLYIDQQAEDEDTARELIWEDTIDAYDLGSALEDVHFKDALVDAALLSMLGDGEGVTWFPGRRLRQRLYDCTSQGCGMRKLVVHLAASLTNIHEITSEHDPVDFLEELSRELKEGSEEDTHDLAASCAFHEHAPGSKNCYRGKNG